MRFGLTCLCIAIVFAVRSQSANIPVETILLRSSSQNFQPSLDSIAHRVRQLPINNALTAIDKLLRLSAKLPHSVMAFRRLSEMGRLYYNEQYISPKYLLYSLSILDDPAFAKPEVQKVILGDIGSLYYNVLDYDNTEYYLKKYLALDAPDEPSNTINLHTTLGLVYMEKGKDSLALTSMHRALELAEKANHKIWIGLSHGNLGNALFRLKRYEEALTHLRLDMVISQQQQQFSSKAGSQIIIGQIYLAKGNTVIAKPYLDSVMEYLDSHAGDAGLSNFRVKAYRAMADYYEQTGAHAIANAYLKRGWQLRDSINLQRNRQGIVMQVTEMKAMKERQQEMLLQATLEHKRKNETIFIVCITAALLLIVLGFVLLRQKQRMNRVLKEKNASIVLQNEATEQREKYLQQSNEAKTKLFSIIAHDLRAPMGNLQALLGMVEQGSIDQDTFQQLLPEVSTKVSTLSSTIDNLLSWTYSQMDGIVANKEEVDIHAMVNGLLAFVKQPAENKQLQLVNNVAVNSMLYADRHHVETILRNLLSNAIKFSKERGMVTINATNKDGQMVLSVADNGVGMPKEKMQQLFNGHYNNVSSMGTMGEKGTGLGLVICKELVVKNGGSIWAEANEPRGTVFKVSFQS